MNNRSPMYKRYRFPPQIIQHVVWLYHRFNLSARDIEDLLSERGIAVSYETIRLWCIKFGPKYAKSNGARLDWACHKVFHARAPLLFDTNKLKRLAARDYPELRFKLGPACRLVHSAYPIFRIWKVNQENSGSDQDVNLDDGPESVAVIRPDLDVELWRLDLAEGALLQSLASGKKLSESVEASLKHSQDFNLRAVLDKFLAAGVLVAAEENAGG